MSGSHIDTTGWWERYRADVQTEKPHRITVFFRSLAPSQGSHDRRSGILDRVERAAEMSVLDSYDITVVGEGLCLCDDCASTRIARRMHETLQTLRRGGSEDIEPTGFVERPVDSQMTGEHYRLLVPPEVSLAVYVGDSLRGVFPATVGGASVSVDGFLDALETLGDVSARAQTEIRPPH
jgi:hypothetical protein